MSTARTNYILVDYENVQPTPEELALVKGRACKVKVFVGKKELAAGQTKLPSIPIAFLEAMQSLGSDGEFIFLKATGKNALDFCLTYHLGLIAAQDPTAFFHIISKDKHDFGPLVEHLKATHVLVQRWDSISSIPYFQRPVPAALNGLVKVATEKLQNRKKAWPNTEKWLRNWLCSLAGGTLMKEEQEQALAALFERGVVKVIDGKLQYNLQTSA